MIRILLFLLVLLSFSYSNQINKAFAFAIYNENGQSENIQNINITKYDYNEICYTKIAVFGKLKHNTNIEVKIGNSIGAFENKIPITNIGKIVIGYEYTFKHYTVTTGRLEVRVDNKLYDARVFVK